MGELRARLLGPHAEVVLAGGDAERTRRVADAAGARAASVEEALGERPDAVVIASATDRHSEHIRLAAALGVPVLCEKPLALTLDEARDAVEALAGVPAQIGFQRRFDPGLRALRAADVGTVYSVRITDRDASVSPEHFIPGSGGMYRDMHVHDFDLARWLTGREVARVYATGTVRKHERYARHGDVDTAAIVLTMDDGVLVTIDGLRHDPRGQDVRVEIAGSEDVVRGLLGPDRPARARRLDAGGRRLGVLLGSLRGRLRGGDRGVRGAGARRRGASVLARRRDRSAGGRRCLRPLPRHRVAGRPLSVGRHERRECFVA